MAIEKINIIGSGKLASHLVSEFENSSRIEVIYSRNEIEGQKLAERCGAEWKIDEELSKNQGPNLNLIAVNDDAIKIVAEKIPKESRVVHSSGSVSMQIFAGHKNAGVIYPLQSFTKNRPVEFSKIPFFVEANSGNFEKELVSFIQNNLSLRVSSLSSPQRLKLHLAAVIANNFSNFLLQLTEEYINQEGLHFKELDYLMEETIAKAFEIGPSEAQTGPAIRNDQETINQHLRLIPDPQFARLYRYFTELIQSKM